MHYWFIPFHIIQTYKKALYKYIFTKEITIFVAYFKHILKIIVMHNEYKNVKNLLFDFGGVIVSLSKANAIARFKEIGFENIDDFLGEFRQKGIFLDYETGKIDRDNFLKEFRRLGNNKATMEEIDSAWLAFLLDIPLYKYDLLKELRKKYRVLLLSNTNPSVSSWARSSQFSPTGETIEDFFDKCYLSYEIGCAKPEREIFHFITKDAGILPEETLFFDDGVDNIRAADELGFQVYLTNQEEDLRKVFERVR